jgi:hypothetical protein
LFIDRQNVYKGARDTFDLGRDFHTKGQVNPIKLGELVASRVAGGTDRRLTEVRIYRGFPMPESLPRETQRLSASGPHGRPSMSASR